MPAVPMPTLLPAIELPKEAMTTLLEYAERADRCHIRLCELADNDRSKWTPQYWRNLEGHEQAIKDSVCGLPTSNGHVCDLAATAHTQHRQLNEHGGAIWWNDYATKDQSYPERQRAQNWTSDDIVTDLDDPPHPGWATNAELDRMFTNAYPQSWVRDVMLGHNHQQPTEKK